MRQSLITAGLLLSLLAAPVVADEETESRHSDEDFRKHVEELKKKLPSDDFHIVIEKPFVVIGDESAKLVKLRAEGTVRWAVTALKKKYFDKDPHHIIDVWLFQNKASYEKHVEQLWGEKPHTPFGYYSPSRKALIMNIATGGGTLVHEIVHPFVESNFPRCPAWFNEGLGSLYEQCKERDGQIVGLTNWRLAGLQRAILGKKLPTFKELCATTRHQFYSLDRGANYAQARYLCYYLQEHGLLKKFYDEFRANYKTDPHGYETLTKVLGEEDMEQFQEKWEKWVLRLKYR